MAVEPEVRWTQDDWGEGFAPDGPSPVRRFLGRHGWLVRGAILLMALLLFKLTADAALATVVSCLEFGRTDFGTARWLWAVDPDRRRGRLTALCYLAGGCCRVGIVAMAAASFIPLLVVWFAPPGPRVGPPQHLVGALLMMAAAFLASAALSLWVSLAALISGHRLWLGPEPGMARRGAVWPPSRVVLPPGHRPENQAKALFYLAGILVLAIGMSATIFVAIAALSDGAMWALLAVLALLGLGFVAGVAILEGCVLARSPRECWPIEGESASTDPPDRL